MGIQITIEIQDLEEAGWSCKVEDETCWDYDFDRREDVPSTHQYLVISKGQWEFCSYLPDCFFADCNEWGSNIHRFSK